MSGNVYVLDDSFLCASMVEMLEAWRALKRVGRKWVIVQGQLIGSINFISITSFFNLLVPLNLALLVDRNPVMQLLSWTSLMTACTQERAAGAHLFGGASQSPPHSQT